MYRNINSYFFISSLLTLLGAMPISLQAQDIAPVFRLHTQGSINDFVVEGSSLYVATDRGSVDIFDLRSKNIIHQIVLEPILTSRNTLVSASISSVDVLNEKVLLVSRDKDNYRNVWIYENYKLRKIIDSKQKLLIKEARFVDDNRIVFTTVDADLILYDTDESYEVYHKHISQSTLGDMTLSLDKKNIFTADESGEVKVFDINSSKAKASLPPQNLDNVFHVAHSEGVTITGGQDRRIGVYQEAENPYYLKSDFLVYCVGISPSGETGVYTSGEDNDLQLFDTYTKKKKDRLIGHKGIVNQIKFVNETSMISSEQGHEICFWKISK